MKKARMDGLYLMVLGSAIFVLLGLALENAAPVTTVDFRLVYYSARCLLEHRDPYQELELERTYQREGGLSSHDTNTIRRTETQYIYLPTSFALTLPFAILPFGPAHIFWLLLTAVSTLLGAFMMWDVGAKYAPILSGALIGLTIANCELFLAVAGPGGIAIALCVIAVWCFVRSRMAPLGVLCLAISLMLKPHDAGMVWLYFLLAGGIGRKRALQTVLVVVCLSLPIVLWLSHVAPNWVQELSANLAANAAPGGLSDPGSASKAGHGIAMIISLQTVFSFFRDDPHFYNLGSYLVSGGLLLVWMIKTLRWRSPLSQTWIALAPVTALSMLPVYHRLDDAKLLFLAIPACAMLWEESGATAWVALTLTSAGILLTSSIPWAIFLGLLKYARLSETGWTHQLLIAAQVFPAPIILLSLGAFYLWVYVRRASGSSDRERTEATEQLPIVTN
jgi:hypothetical protein